MTMSRRHDRGDKDAEACMGLAEEDWKYLEDTFKSEFVRRTGLKRPPMHEFRIWKREMEPALARMPHEEALRHAEGKLRDLIEDVVRIYGPRAPPEEVIEVAPEELMAFRRELRALAPHLVRYFPPWMGVRYGPQRVPEEILRRPLTAAELELFKEWLEKRYEREVWVHRGMKDKEHRNRYLRRIRETHERWLKDPSTVPEVVRMTFRQEVWARPITPLERAAFEKWLEKPGLSMVDYMLMPEEHRKTLRMWFRVHALLIGRGPSGRRRGGRWRR